MHHFAYRNGVLHAEDVSLLRIAEEVGTPFYCYSSATMVRHLRVFREGLAGMDASICYAMKANSSLAVLRTLVKEGAGCDVVSGGELQLALAAGVDPKLIVFSGVGKTDEEFVLALEKNVGQINVESAPELEALSRVAAKMGKTARVALRVNPDVDASTHDKISTGRKEDKFGIEWSMAPALYRRAKTLPGIDPSGVAVHIGSQITDLAPFEAAFNRVKDLVLSLRNESINIRHVDLGGGLGVPYDSAKAPPPSPADYGAMVKRIFADLGCKLSFEPGRLIVGNAGILVSRVIFMKDGSARKFAIVDAGMNDLMRPAMYGAKHEIMTVAEPTTAAKVTVDVVGPVCESSDRFAQGVDLPALQAGDLIAFMTAGAYGATMSSTYNARPLVPEVLVNGDKFAVTRRRPTFAEMTSLEQTPPWLD